MLGQTLLDTMELLNQELQLQAGEADVTRGLLALNIAQDFFEGQAAKIPNIFGSQVGTLIQTAGVESTQYPTGLLRIDRLWYIDPATFRPAWKLSPRKEVGEHASASGSWMLNLTSSNSTGKPVGYFTNGTTVYWDPLPDGANQVRWYGFTVAADISAAAIFAYPDIVRLPLATFATAVLKLGVDDDPSALNSLSTNLFSGVLETLGGFNRDGAAPLQYTQDHR